METHIAAIWKMPEKAGRHGRRQEKRNPREEQEQTEREGDRKRNPRLAGRVSRRYIGSAATTATISQYSGIPTIVWHQINMSQRPWMRRHGNAQPGSPPQSTHHMSKPLCPWAAATIVECTHTKQHTRDNRRQRCGHLGAPRTELSEGGVSY